MTFHRIFENQGRRSAVGFALSLLLHAGLLLFALEHAPMPIKESGFEPDAPLVVNLLPPSEAVRAAPPARSAPQAPSRRLQAKKARPTAVPRKPAPPQTQVLTKQAQPAPAPVHEQAVPADMADMLAAARDRRRAAGIPDANDAPDQPAEKDADAIARDNIAFSVQSRGQNDSGGVFQVTSKGVRTAELIFRGWDVRRRNVTRQAFEIDAGLNGDIDTAIIRKMIELIRQQKKGDFHWESRRLGRVVVLSARPQDDAELEAFLKKDFFAIYN